jgi:hypothetical protein
MYAISSHQIGAMEMQVHSIWLYDEIDQPYTVTMMCNPTIAWDWVSIVRQTLVFPPFMPVAFTRRIQLKENEGMQNWWNQHPYILTTVIWGCPSKKQWLFLPKGLKHHICGMCIAWNEYGSNLYWLHSLRCCACMQDLFTVKLLSYDDLLTYFPSIWIFASTGLREY